MMNMKRRWSVLAWPGTAQELAARLKQPASWVGCAGFSIGQVVLLNDSSSEDGAQEFAVVAVDSGQQVESLTISWMEEERLAGALERLANGHEWVTMERDWPAGEGPRERIDTPQAHGRCALCA